ncbi:MAG TPA: hypothetical protein VMB05_05285 [Solirubrobacteraceae bacterium]|nr:hypothetical protein [Solirubrobacteraceae bacterium]
MTSSGVYWTNASAVVGVPLAGGAPQTLAYGDGLLDIAADDEAVYWTSSSAVMRLSLLCACH